MNEPIIPQYRESLSVEKDVQVYLSLDELARLAECLDTAETRHPIDKRLYKLLVSLHDKFANLRGGK